MSEKFSSTEKALIEEFQINAKKDTLGINLDFTNNLDVRDNVYEKAEEMQIGGGKKATVKISDFLSKKITNKQKNESFSFDSRELPDDDDAKMLAPAWYYDDLAKHEWEKHGTCAVWPETMLGSVNTINEKATTTLTQRSFYRGMFALAKELGTPKALAKSAGSKISIEELKKAFIIDSSSFSVAAFGCYSKCNFVQVVQCF